MKNQIYVSRCFCSSVFLLFVFFASTIYSQSTTAVPSPTPTPQTDAKPSSTNTPTAVNCNESSDMAKRCIDAIVTVLQDMKETSESYAGLLKAENKGTSELQSKYNSVRDKAARVVTAIEKSKPDFTFIQTNLILATKAADDFKASANRALIGSEPSSYGIFESIKNLIFDNVCKFMPSPITETVCDWVVGYIKTLELRNKVTLRKWSKIPAMNT